ncbi:MAG: hypothetical protein HEQ38_03610 [Gemmatimonas sp.]|nr:hypothetical protein [Gemmatimonas sp.]
MDCKHFRKHHLAYLDDTLPGDLMAQAQHHVFSCDCCAAHDTLVRRSLMVARSLNVIEPSAEFQSRLRARLAECREERAAMTASGVRPHIAMADDFAPRVVPMARSVSPRPARALVAVAASAVLGVIAFRAFHNEAVPTLAMQPVIASRPAAVSSAPYLTPMLQQAMSTGNPVWSAAMVVEDAPVGFVNAEYRFAELR